MRIFAWLVLGALLFTGVIFAGNAITGTRGFYGPFKCASCTLGAPMPDEGTIAFIRTMDNAYAAQGYPYYRRNGDQFTICTNSICVDYTRSDDNRWRGGQPYPQKNNNTGSGGGGGSGGAGETVVGGAGPGAAGCVYGCSDGTVTVGPVKQTNDK